MAIDAATLNDKLKFYFQRWPGRTSFTVVGGIVMYTNTYIGIKEAALVRRDLDNYFNMYADFYPSVTAFNLHVELQEEAKQFWYGEIR